MGSARRTMAIFQGQSQQKLTSFGDWTFHDGRDGRRFAVKLDVPRRNNCRTGKASGSRGLACLVRAIMLPGFWNLTTTEAAP